LSGRESMTRRYRQILGNHTGCENQTATEKPSNAAKTTKMRNALLGFRVEFIGTNYGEVVVDCTMQR